MALSLSISLGTFNVAKKSGSEFFLLNVLFYSITYRSSNSTAFGLLFGLTLNILLIMLHSSLDYELCIGVNFPFITLSYNPFILSALKGGYPLHNSYIHTPRDHISHFISYFLSFQISGGHYYGVPVCVFAKLSSFKIFDTFKSPSFVFLSLQINKLAGFISRWIILCECRSRNPLSAFVDISHISFSSINLFFDLCFLMSFSKSPFSAYSMIIQSVRDLSS